jgi:hypothetical protein
VNGEVHGGRPRPTGAVVPRKKNYYNTNYKITLLQKYFLHTVISVVSTLLFPGNSNGYQYLSGVFLFVVLGL